MQFATKRRLITAAKWIACFYCMVGGVTVSGPLAAAARDEVLYAKAEQNQTEAIQLLERLVNIDTGTGQEKGLDQLVEILTGELSRLGANVDLVTSAPMAGKNVVATSNGAGKGKVLLIAHMDTVFKAGTASERPFRIEGRRAYGPGVCDDKGGIVVGLYALKILHDLNYTNFGTITLMLNTNEEVGSLGSRRLIESLARKHNVAFNLEAGRVGDKLVIWRKGSGVIEVTARGKSSHAGNAPELGRNAATEMAHQALQLGKLEDPVKLTTVNVTVVQSGDRENVIPDYAVAKADVRALTTDEFSRVERDLAEMVKNKLIPDTQITATLTRGFPPMPRNAATDALAAQAKRVYAELGRNLGMEGAGGAADSSFCAGVGTPSLDGLGLIGSGGHGPDEFADLESMVPRLYLLSRLVMEAGKGNQQ
jgi:glutamate carboxypeptidase